MSPTLSLNSLSLDFVKFGSHFIQAVPGTENDVTILSEVWKEQSKEALSLQYKETIAFRRFCLAGVDWVPASAHS